MMTDPIADMLTRIRNAAAINKAEVLLPYSRIKHEIASVLVRENYLQKAEKVEDGANVRLKLSLKYRSNGKSCIKHIKRLSLPSRRLYVSQDKLPNVLSGYGIAVISSSQGIMSNKEARKQKVGGELLLEIW